MRSPSRIEVRRCRPLLGTFVEISARGRDERLLARGIEAGFAAIATVHRLLSWRRLSGVLAHESGRVSKRCERACPWTWQVAKASKRFAEESHGMFDITVAPWLTKWNYLPRRGYQFSPTASSRDIFLRRNCEVFFRRGLIVDLGGIAKGFAVDRAVDALKENGIECGLVNAGGDLRTFWPGIAAYSSATSHRSDARCRSGAAARACHGDFCNLF
jgi:thiamine biosynthesis lipoprotein